MRISPLNLITKILVWMWLAALITLPIFLHIRQSDNIGREEFHPILPLSYYEEAASHFPKDTPCFVLTDDIDWCKQQSFFDDDRFMFNESNGRYSYKTIDGTGKMQNTLLCLRLTCV